MDINEIKKEIYKQKPQADFHRASNGILYYTTAVNYESAIKIVRFDIPFSDIGDAKFFPKMEAKLLIRWMNIDLEF